MKKIKTIEVYEFEYSNISLLIEKEIDTSCGCVEYQVKIKEPLREELLEKIIKEFKIKESE